jgi:hypothetical protein
VLAGAALIKKRIRHRFGIRAPRVAVRAHVPWYFWGGLVLTCFLLLIALASWLYESGRLVHRTQGAADIELLLLRQHELQAEVSHLREIVDTGESKYQIEQTAGQQLARQIKVLESENASLKEDLSFFEGLVPGGDATKAAGPKISRLRVDPDLIAGQYRYRMLVVQSGGKLVPVFHGRLQLAIKIRREGKDAMIILSDASVADSAKFNVEVKYFQRIEGVFLVPAGAVVHSVEARLMQGGSVFSRQEFAL